MRKAKQGQGRGVFVAPWQGEHGEFVLLARTSRNTLATAPVEVPLGASHIDAADQLFDLLDRVDPDPRQRLRVI